MIKKCHQSVPWKRAMSSIMRTDLILDEGEDDSVTMENRKSFNDLTNLNAKTKRAISYLKLEKMTEIQEKTFEAASNGQDVLGRARTGTGKTLAFLLPTIESIVRNSNNRKTNEIGAVIISPTRELATQIGYQAYALLKFHEDLSVQTMYGGVPKQLDIKRLTRKIPSIIVTTPGRFKAHLEETYIKNKRFSDIICQNDQHQRQVLVLDETDRLLDMGFIDDIQDIISFLPPKSQRQTLLFSATIPSDLKTVMKKTLSNDYLYVDCIQDEDPSTQTNKQVDQYYVELPGMNRFVSGVLETIWKAKQEKPNDYKIIVFFPTAMMANYFSHLFNDELYLSVVEIHAKLTQSERTKASNQYRNMKKGILFTTDVSARGVDYPDVSHVIQFGLPESREAYVHRLGRTGRAGKKGKGWLILTPFEMSFLNELHGLDIENDIELQTMFQSPMQNELINILDPILNDSRDDPKLGQLAIKATKAYQTMMSFYASKMQRLIPGISKANIVQHMNEFSFHAGLDDPPAMNANFINKLGFRNVPGLNLYYDNDGDNNEYSKYNDTTYTRYKRGKQSPNGNGSRRGGKISQRSTNDDDFGSWWYKS